MTYLTQMLHFCLVGGKKTHTSTFAVCDHIHKWRFYFLRPWAEPASMHVNDHLCISVTVNKKRLKSSCPSVSHFCLSFIFKPIKAKKIKKNVRVDNWLQWSSAKLILLVVTEGKAELKGTPYRLLNANCLNIALYMVFLWLQLLPQSMS